MCYHVKQTKSADELEKRFKATLVNKKNYQPTLQFSAFDFPFLPIIRKDNVEELACCKWGLVPAFAKEDFDKTKTLNARIETIAEKVSYKNYTENRCIIPIESFYEWQHMGKSKIKCEMSVPNQIVALAGLYADDTFTVITTEATGVMQKISQKNRMPIVLSTDEAMQQWLQEGQWTPYSNFNVYPPLQATLF